MDTSQVLLGLIGAAESSHGYELKSRYDQWFGTRKALAFGQVYATLARLIRDGLIAELGTESGEGPDRKRFQITETGAQQVRQWMFTPDAPQHELKNNLFAKTIIALMLDDNAEQLIDLQRQAHIARMRKLTREKTQSSDLATVLVIDYALFHIEADLRWIELTTLRLEQLKKEVQQ